MWSLLGIIIGTCMTMASFIVEAVVPDIHNLIRGHKFWSRYTKTSKIKHLENRALYGNSAHVIFVLARACYESSLCLSPRLVIVLACSSYHHKLDYS